MALPSHNEITLKCRRLKTKWVKAIHWYYNFMMHTTAYVVFRTCMIYRHIFMFVESIDTYPMTINKTLRGESQILLIEKRLFDCYSAGSIIHSLRDIRWIVPIVLLDNKYKTSLVKTCKMFATCGEGITHGGQICHIGIVCVNSDLVLLSNCNMIYKGMGRPCANSNRLEKVLI